MTSFRRSFTIANIKKMSTIKNGDAATMVTFCRLFSASSPVSSSTRPTAAVRTPQMADSHGVASERPFWDMEPITVDAESAEVMKKVASRIIPITAATEPPGKDCSRLNSSASVDSPEMDVPFWSKWIAVPPKIAYQRVDTPAGTSMTPRQNSRTRRPPELRPKNIPPNGDQEIRHAQ